MFNAKHTALYIAMGAMALAANEAIAGCKLISGTYICASWITGSEICQVTVDSNVSPGFDPSTQKAECFINGVGISNEPPPTYFCDDTTLFGDQTCSSTTITTTITAPTNTNNGVAWAGTNPKRQGPKCGNDKFTPPKNPSCGTPDLSGASGDFSSDPFSLGCNPSTGLCSGSGEVLPPDGALCSSGGTLLDFTASQFLGTVIIGQPNASDPASDPAFILYQLCSLDPSGKTYSCTDLNPSDVDQFSCPGGFID